MERKVKGSAFPARECWRGGSAGGGEYMADSEQREVDRNTSMCRPIGS